jgi:hypothetical protein
MLPKWWKADAVLGGTETMRAAGEEYLPQHAGEADDRYTERLNTAVLWNQSELTLNNWSGRPFSDPLILNEDVPKEIEDAKTNIDLQGTDLHVFAQSWFSCGLSKGFCHVLVDMPRREEGHVTLADDRSSGSRPYWSLIEPERVIGARATVINGVETVTHLRVMEVSTAIGEDGYTESIVERIREYNLVVEVDEETEIAGEPYVAVTVWRYIEDKDRETKEAWVREEDFNMEIDTIPLVTFYADRQGFLLSKPPLIDLYDLNIQHWQRDADHNAVISVASFPILAMSGVDEIPGTAAASGIPGDLAGGRIVGGGPKGETIIGPFSVLRTPEGSGRIYYVEHQGNAIEAGSKSIGELEHRMSSYGAAFLKKQPGRQTATARSLDSAESISPLASMTLRFQSALEQALGFHAKWLGQESGGTATIITDFGPEEVKREDFESLKFAFESGIISREAYIIELKRRGVLNDKYDAEDDLKLIEAAAEAAIELAKKMQPEPEPGQTKDGSTGDEPGDRGSEAD